MNLAEWSPADIFAWLAVVFMFAALGLIIVLDRLWPTDGSQKGEGSGGSTRQNGEGPG